MTANIGLDSSVGESAGMSNHRSRVQAMVQSNFLCSSEIYYLLVITVEEQSKIKFEPFALHVVPAVVIAKCSLCDFVHVGTFDGCLYVVRL